MSETNSTILIPDISGFTEFMTTTELSHSVLAINMLIDAIVKAVGEEYQVTEIEGDAVLFVRKGPAPTKKEIVNICLKIFNAFHFQRRWMEKYTVCPCGACQALDNLTLKFVAHHGPLTEIKVGSFVKPSGTDMIVAHRLLKNSIHNNEYLIMTEKLIQNVPDPSESSEMEWVSSFEEYASIGKVEYLFTLFNQARKDVPEPPSPQTSYRTDGTSFLEIPIADNFRDVYMSIMNIPDRPDWVPGLQKVEQDIAHVFIGNVHHCSFEDYETDVTPVRMTVSSDQIIYAEICEIKEQGISLVYEYILKKVDDTHTLFGVRMMNTDDSSIPEKINAILLSRMQQMAERLKERSENKGS